MRHSGGQPTGPRPTGCGSFPCKHRVGRGYHRLPQGTSTSTRRRAIAEHGKPGVLAPRRAMTAVPAHEKNARVCVDGRVTRSSTRPANGMFGERRTCRCSYASKRAQLFRARQPSPTPLGLVGVQQCAAEWISCLALTAKPMPCPFRRSLRSRRWRRPTERFARVYWQTW